MAIRSSRSGRLIALALLMVTVVTAIAWSAVLVSKSLRALAAQVLVTAIAPLLEGIAAAVYWMMLQEIALAMVVWATRGPFWTLAWISIRASTWLGG